MRTIRDELCEVVQRILPVAPSVFDADGAKKMSDLAPVFATAIANAILDDFHVTNRILPRRFLATNEEAKEPSTFTYDPSGRRISAIDLGYAKSEDGSSPKDTWSVTYDEKETRPINDDKE